MDDIEFLIAVLFAAAVLVRLADLLAIPYPIVLVIGGVAIGFVPGLPQIELEPEVVFLVFLPPLLQAAGFNASPQELRAATAQLVSLTFVLVLATMAAVAVVAHAVVDGLSWQTAFVLGAILGPTDPVAAAATFSRMGVPERVVLAVESEAMLNDAAALVAYKVAVAAAVTGTFTLGSAVIDFAGSAVAGVAFGFAVAWFGVRVLRRLADVPLAILLTLLFSYGAYIGAEHVHDLIRDRGVGRARRGDGGDLVRLALARDGRRRHAAEHARLLADAGLRPQRHAVRAARAAARGHLRTHQHHR